MTRPKPVLLLILDGWGASQEIKGNAILAAQTPTWDKLIATHPYTEIEGCGETVGLPHGQMGNSEVGHLTIGAGRIVHQDLSKINLAVQDGSFFHNPILRQAFLNAEKTQTAVHVMGLLSPGGVHSHEDHIFALLEHSKHYNCPVYIHAFLDGRDTSPKSAEASLEKLEKIVAALPKAHIATLMGRYYAMDRDNRWDRIERAFNAIVHAKAELHFSSTQQALSHAYAHNLTDEFVLPSIVDAAYSGIQSTDTVLFMNFRSDRARQMSHALSTPDFSGFDRLNFKPIKQLVTLTEYDSTLKAAILFPKTTPKNGLGEYLQTLGLQQLRIAETEKYAHVTFFFNGGVEAPCEGEERILIPSPKVQTYDLKPQMSALEITEHLTQAIASRRFDVIICNFANADMVGHTGNFKATIEAIECLDQCLSKIIASIEAQNGALLITADHGNADCMYETNTDNPHTAHTLAKVPFVYCGSSSLVFKHQVGSLQDVAPTLLHVMGITPPKEMTGVSLLTDA
ncbi:2,3-bisphosphoglycerate-independent phosphoglycerate mutase [Candidatus Berkiella cookevillensis]|uniref:2,3-bisphosphoglycerate-independent phosphoglycerate mutase n=1 Tax=Candidatus Berkiella cookevillensis TaxID=437022 RepID=A0A0Q9YQ07_9GAMM|nr:2,3-bisphosphoglycerate-independent phosphoglycerate mutase [Candidatus Berkiella cookevillensis]MCS5709666.1 2,3-bisphosphoglycerate-independent phosphoglycerate mutase [Candidatus Berkiella cookevillensis]